MLRRRTGSAAASVRGAGVGRAELEAAAGGVGGERVDELAADQLGAGNPRLRRLQVLLQQGDAIRWRLVVSAGQAGVEFVVTGEEADAMALPALVVLADERNRQLARGGGEIGGPGHRHGARHVQSVRAQRDQLLNLADLQLEDLPAVHHPAAVRPSQLSTPRACSFANGWPRVCADALIRDQYTPCRRRLVEVEHCLAEQPLLVRQPGRSKAAASGAYQSGFSWIT